MNDYVLKSLSLPRSHQLEVLRSVPLFGIFLVIAIGSSLKPLWPFSS